MFNLIHPAARLAYQYLAITFLGTVIVTGTANVIDSTYTDLVLRRSRRRACAVEAEIERRIASGELVRPGILHGKTEADRLLRKTFIDTEIKCRIDAGLLAVVTPPTPTPA